MSLPFSKGHTASKWLSKDCKLRESDSRARSLTTVLCSLMLNEMRHIEVVCKPYSCIQILLQMNITEVCIIGTETQSIRSSRWQKKKITRENKEIPKARQSHQCVA